MNLALVGYGKMGRMIEALAPEYGFNVALILDINNLVLCSHETHNAIHFGSRALLREQWTERQPGDTKLW